MTTTNTVISTPQPQPLMPRRMSLDNVTSGRIERPYRLLVYGPPGVGKSTFAADMPSPVFIPVETGSDELDVARLPQPRDWSELMEAVHVLNVGDHSFRTVVIDTIDHAELLLHAHIVATDPKGAKSMGDAAGGYGKSYRAAIDRYRELAVALEQLQRRREVNLCLVAHSATRTVSNPAGEDYGMFGLKMYDGNNANSGAFWVEWANDVLFLSHNVLTRAVKNGDKVKHKATAAADRVIYTQRTPFAEAKTRHRIPSILPLDRERPFRLFDDHVARSKPVSIQDARGEIPALIQMIPEEKRPKASAYLATIQEDATKLNEMLARLRADTGGIREEDAES